MKKSKLLLFALSFMILASGLFGSVASAAPNHPWMHSNKTELSAHRGAQVAAPENTLEAITQAGLLGYGFIEIDIRKTKDDQYILMHDETVNRTTTGTGKVKDLTFEQIQGFAIKDKQGNVTNHKVPTLEEVLREARKYNLVVNFDGSKGDWGDKEFVDGIMDIAKETEVLNHSFFVLSNKSVRDQFNKWYPDAVVTFLGNALKNVDADIKELKKYENAIYSTSIHNVDKESARKIKREGIKLHVYSVNTAETYEKAKKIHPRLIETDVIVPGDNWNEKSVKLRVMSYNIHYGHNMNNQYDLESIATVIRDSKADIIGLQEVDVHWGTRSNFENEIKTLAENLNMHYFYAPIYTNPAEQEGQPDRQFGVGILSKYPIMKAENREIARLSTQVANPVPELMPGFAETLINVKGINVNVYSTHLDYRADPTIRQMQVADMLNVMSESNNEKILIGDMNAKPTAPELAPLFSTFKNTWTEVNNVDGFTFPANKPNRTIDYILTTHGIQTESAETINTQASDHLPLISDVLLFR